MCRRWFRSAKCRRRRSIRRRVKDYEFERDMAEVNHRLTGIETVLLFTDAKYSCVSSSIVRELISYHKDVKDFLP